MISKEVKTLQGQEKVVILLLTCLGLTIKTMKINGGNFGIKTILLGRFLHLNYFSPKEMGDSYASVSEVIDFNCINEPHYLGFVRL